MLDPYSPQSIADPVSFWANLREQIPVFEVPGSPNHYLISRYEDVRHACENVEVFSSELLASVQRGPDGRPRLLGAPMSDSPQGRVLGVADGVVHRRHRRLLAGAFTRRKMNTFEDWIRQRTQLLFRERTREFDGMKLLATPLPVQTMTHLLGLPAKDCQQLLIWSESAMRLIGGLVESDALAEHFQDLELLQGYLDEQLETVALAGGSSMSDRGAIGLLSSALAAGTIEAWEASGLLLQLVVGGTDTSVGIIGAAILRLAEDPIRFRQLREDRADVGPFIEETLRLDGPAIGNYRRTQRDTELSGTRIPKGSTLTLLWGSANRDEDQFSNADEFDMKRTNLKSHLAFGHGAHLCIGSALARLEAQIVIDTLLDSGHLLQLGCHPESLKLVPSLFIRKLASLPVRLD